MAFTVQPPRFVLSRPECDSACEHRRSDDVDECVFRVAWSINPHMEVGSVSPRDAVDEHARFVSALESVGAQVDTMPFVHGAFDSVFSKDNAVLVERSPANIEALLAWPRHSERQTEQDARARSLTMMGLRVTAESCSPLEGGDVVMLPNASGAFLGTGFRSERYAAKTLSRFLDRDVVCIELRDPRLYHLDMVLSILDEGVAVLCREAITDQSRRLIESHASIREVVEISLDEALSFGANLVQVGNHIVSGALGAPRALEALGTHGYDVHRVSLEQFHRAGGSAACLVSRVHRQAVLDAHSAVRRAADRAAA